MKKVLFSILAIGVLASCTKTEPVFTEVDQEIKITPVTSMVTKAAIDGTEYPGTEKFKVIGYWADQPAGTVEFEAPTVYLDNVTFAKQEGGQYWAGDGQSYYWPKNGSLRFAAYSPSSIEGMSHELATDTWSVKGYTQSNDTENTIDFMVAQTPPSYTAQTAAENVSVVFEHALSWLSFRVKAQDAAAAEAFVVKSITVNNVNTVADMVAEYPAKEWSNWTTPLAYEVFKDNVAPKVEPVEIENNGVLVIPQATTSVTVTFVQNTLKDVEQSIEIPLVLDVENTPWEAGKHYVYTLIFGLDEILINPSVADWEDVNVNDVPVTEYEVTTAEELAAAINNGGQVRLAADITLDEVFAVNKSINIDLAGYTLTGNAADILFRVNDGATLTIGRGAVVATDYIASANVGGVIVVNNGDYKAATTCFQANGGEVYITGGRFEDIDGTWESAYLLNHIDGKKNDGLIEVTGGTFVEFNPAAAPSESPVMNFVKKGYNVVSTEVDGKVEYTVYPAEGDVTLTAATTAASMVNVANSVYDGNGQTLTAAVDANFLTANSLRLINTIGDATIKNLTIDGNNAEYTANGKTYGLRAIFLTGEGTVNIENVTIKNVTYTLNDDAATKTLNVKDSVLEGWTSYNPGTTANFENVSFEVGLSQKTFRPHGNTVLSNCTFEKGFVINLDKLVEAGSTIKFDKCTYDGVVITAENYTECGITNGNDANILF